MEEYVICSEYSGCTYKGTCMHRRPHIYDNILCGPIACNATSIHAICSPVSSKVRSIENDVNEWFDEIKL